MILLLHIPGGGGALLNAPRPYSLLFLKSPGCSCSSRSAYGGEIFRSADGKPAMAYRVYVETV